MALEFTYSTNEYVDANLIDPTGKMAGTTILDPVATRDSVSMTTYGDSPIPGTYRLVVLYLDDQIFEKSFTFDGAKISIGKVSLNWSYVSGVY